MGTLDPTRLFPFLDFLRSQGYVIGVDQYITMRDLLVALSTANQLPKKLEDMGYAIAPVLCTTPQEQQNLLPLLRQWVEENPGLKSYFGFSKPRSTLDEPIDTAFALPSSSSRSSKYLLPTFCLLVIIGLFFTDPWDPPPSPDPLPPISELTGKIQRDSLPLEGARVTYDSAKTVTNEDGTYVLDVTEQPISGTLTIEYEDETRQMWVDRTAISGPLDYNIQQPEKPKPEETDEPLPNLEDFYNNVARVNKAFEVMELQEQSALTLFLKQWYVPLRFGFIGLFLLIWAYILQRNWRQMHHLRQNRVLADHEREPLHLQKTSVNLFDTPDWRMATQEMRRHLSEPTDELEDDATVQASVENGGLFTPIYKKQLISPEYLLLVDRSSFDDHQVQLLEVLIKRLSDVGNYLDIYFFRDTPQTLIHRNQGSSLSLEQVTARHMGARLVLCSDGSCCFNPYTGNTFPWFSLLCRWDERALLTSLKPEDWSDHQHYFQDYGFHVLPADAQGLDGLARHFHGQEKPCSQIPEETNYPALFHYGLRPWIRESPPTKGDIKELMEQLQDYLGQSGWLWLQACAGFPGLYWQLTLYLGVNLLHDGKVLFEEERLTRLSSLPWFRRGKMPVWLRTQLLGTMELDRKKALRLLLDRWLSATTDQRQGFMLEFTSNATSSSRRSGPPEEDVHNDATTLSLMEKERGIRFALKLPKPIRQLLYRRGNPLLGLNPLPILFFIAAASFGAIRPWAFGQAWAEYPRLLIVNQGDADVGLGAQLEKPYAASNLTINEITGNRWFKLSDPLAFHYDLSIRANDGFNIPMKEWVIPINGSNFFLVPASAADKWDEKERLSIKVHNHTYNNQSVNMELENVFGKVTDVFWSFGDGEFDRARGIGITHRYTKNGVYTVNALAYYSENNLFHVYGPIKNMINVKHNVNLDNNPASLLLFPDLNMFNILILPFSPTVNCVAQDTNLEEALMIRLLEKSELEGLAIDATFLNDKSVCPTSYDEARYIGAKLGADLVIWGDFYDICDDGMKLCLKYIIVDNQAENSLSFMGKQSVSGDKYDEGRLQGDIDSIIIWALGEREFQRKEWQRSLFYFERVKQKTVELSLRLGQCYYELDQYGKAITSFSEAIRLSPVRSSSFVNRGLAYASLKEYDKAIIDLNEAIRLDPQNIDAFIYRGWAYNLFGKYLEALSDFTEAIRLDPQEVLGFLGSGETYLHMRHYDKAVNAFTEAIRLDPQNAYAFRSRGQTYVTLRQYERAVSDYTEAIRLEPQNAEAYDSRGRIYAAWNLHDKAIADFTEAIRLSPKQSRSFNNRGSAYSGLLQYDKAIADFTEAISLSPQQSDGFLNRGDTYVSLYQYENAILDYEQAIRLNPRLISPHIAIAEVYASLGKWILAVDHLEQAMRLAPGQSLPHIGEKLLEYRKELAKEL